MPKWLSLALLSTLFWGVWAFLVKIGAGNLSPELMQLLFVVGMLPLVAAAAARQGFRVETDRRGVVYGVLNGVLATLGMVAFYVAMERGKASVVGPVTALFPLFTVLGAVLFLRERLNWVQAAGMVLALAAIAVLA
ncbi:MAG: EamA family transporter [Bryobacteraceae bacterium]|nr:EamA family transporter [Bryobacteraceae bacterium]